MVGKLDLSEHQHLYCRLILVSQSEVLLITSSDADSDEMFIVRGSPFVTQTKSKRPNHMK